MAFGSSEGRAFASALKDSVNTWEKLVFDKTDLDTGHARSGTSKGK
jgi:hypothetical protein